MITIQELKEMFETLFEQELDVTNISEDSNLIKDIGMNSVSFLYMAVVLEEKYSIQFTNDDFTKITTVKDVIQIVEDKVQNK